MILLGALEQSFERVEPVDGRVSFELLDRDTQRAVTIQTQTVRLRVQDSDLTVDPL